MSAKRKASTIYTGWWGRRWGQGPEKAEVRATQEQSLKNKQNLKACRNTHSSNRNTEMRCRTKSHPLGKPMQPSYDTVFQVFQFNSHRSVGEMLNPGACRANELAF